MINPQLENKVAIVTGVNNPMGIGAAIAHALSAQGVKIFGTTYTIHEDDTPDEKPDEGGMALYKYGRAQDGSHVIDAIRAKDGDIDIIHADLSNPEIIPAVFDAAENAFGQVDIVVNNATHWEPATFVPSADDLTNTFSVAWMNNDVPTFTPAAHDAVFAVAARATAHMMTEFAKRHGERGSNWGRIINISTDAARNFPSEVVYGAAKLALESYSRSAASELGQFGITVNIVSPGPIQTGYITPDAEKNIAAYTPLRRIGYPEDIADVVVFLTSEQARWVTGQLIHVGGGHRM